MIYSKSLSVMTSKLLIISSSGLKNIILSEYTDEEDFTLIFGDQELRMKSFFADFISPLVSHLHQSDPTIKTIKFDEFYSENKKEFCEFSKSILTSDTISFLQQISSGYAIELNEEQAFKMRFLSIVLGNEELFLKLNELFPPDFSKENVNTYLKYIQSCYNLSILSHDFNFSSLISFISSHFYTLDQGEFLKLPRRLQYLVISHPQLQIKSEDSLFDIILQIIETPNKEEDIDDILLFEQIEFTGLSEVKLRTFLSFFDINEMNASLWGKLSQCFFLHSDNKKSQRIVKKHSIKTEKIEYNGTNENRLNGILTFLGNGKAYDAINNELINIKCSSIFKAQDKPENSLYYDDDSLIFQSKGLPNSWLCVDFQDYEVKLTHYSIKSNSYGGKGHSHPQSWDIEGSNDSSNWIKLDSRRNEKSLDDCGALNTFNIQNENNEDNNDYYRYIRIIQRGVNTHNNNTLAFAAIEFFGCIQSK